MKVALIVVGVLIVLCFCCTVTFFAINFFIRKQELTPPGDRILQNQDEMGPNMMLRPTNLPSGLPEDLPQGY